MGGPCGQSWSTIWLSLRGLDGFCHGLTPWVFTHGRPIEFDPVRMMHQPVEDGICEGWVANDVIPLLYRELTCDDGRLAAIAIIHDLHQIAPLAGGHLFRAPVVQDQNIGAHNFAEDALEAAIAPRGGQFAEEAWHPIVEGDFALPAGLMTQGAGQPGFADPAGPRDQDAAMFGDPSAIPQVLEQSAI